MANTFTRKISRNLGTSPTNIGSYTVAASTTAIVLGISIANTSASPIAVDVALYDGANEYFIILDCPIAPGESAILAGGEQKIVMITGDSNFAYDVMVADYHFAQTKLYWPEEFARLTKLGDSAGLQALRSRSKTTTFARAYGAGVGKTASQLRVSMDEARKILDRVKMRYPHVTEKKEKLAANCLTRVRAGVLPAYVVMLNGSRAMVDSYNGKPQDYTQINYLAQGGVAVIIHKAMIEIEKYLDDHKYKSHMIMEVHDSVIMAFHHWEVANTTIVQDICEIMSHQVPESELKKTIPAVAFVTEYCPSNAKKWGKQIGREYALPTKTFTNRYGTFDLEKYPNPDDPKKAPTWKGPVHLGWTLEKSMEDQKLAQNTLSDGTVVIAPVIGTKKKLDFDISGWGQDFVEALAEITAPTQFAYEGSVTPHLDLDAM